MRKRNHLVTPVAKCFQREDIWNFTTPHYVKHVTIRSANGQTWPNTVTSTQKFNNVNTLSVSNNCIQVTTLGTMSIQTTADSQHFSAAFVGNNSNKKMLSKNMRKIMSG